MVADISRRRFISAAASTLAFVFLRPPVLPAIAAASPGYIPGLTTDSLGRYLAALPYARAGRGPLQSGAGTYEWDYVLDSPPTSMKVIAEADDAQRITSLEARSNGFDAEGFVGDIAALPFTGAEPARARQWAGGTYAQGFARWPEERQFEAFFGGLRFLTSGSFNSSGFHVRLSLVPPT